MSWTIAGHYFENCTCDVVCPCTASFALGANKDRCTVVLVFHIDSGEIEGVDVGGLTLAASLTRRGSCTRATGGSASLVDDAASDEQAGKLGAVFGGALGGPMAALVPLVSEQLGVLQVPMRFESAGGTTAGPRRGRAPWRSTTWCRSAPSRARPSR